jgi:hypothetical protein
VKKALRASFVDIAASRRVFRESVGRKNCIPERKPSALRRLFRRMLFTPPPIKTGDALVELSPQKVTSIVLVLPTTVAAPEVAVDTVSKTARVSKGVA